MSEPLDQALIARGYAEADRDFRVNQAWIGCVLVLICMPLGFALDWFVYPQHLWTIFISRLLCDLAVLPVFALLYTAAGRRHMGTLSIVWALLPALDISWMIWLSQGAASPYYAGLMLVMIVACQLMPYTLRESLLVCGSVIGLYLLACMAHHGTVATSSVLFNNVYFLLLTALICVTSNHFTTRRRMQEFRLRQELDVRNREIAESYKKLSELDKLKSEFFANISHELRTPLTLIVSPLEQLLERAASMPPDARASLGIARQNSLRLLRLINDLLELVRLEEGKADLRFEPLELGPFVAAMADSVRHVATQKGLTLESTGEEGLVVPADPARMEKVVLNILTNAIKFTLPGGTIGVSWRRENGLAVVEFADTGVGIAEGQLPHIFDRFRQADGSSTRKYQGAGIGLALARDLVHEHGGRISARSQLKHGTTLRLELPLAAEGAVTPVQGSWASEHMELDRSRDGVQDPIARIHYDAQRMVVVDDGDGMAEPGAVGQGEHTVLVVDDEPDMRRFLVSALSERYRVLQAADGRAGLEMVRSERPDLVLLDLMLPEMDGLDVCRAIRAEPAMARAKVVLLTARTDEASKLIALERGADDFLTKPFSLAEVRTRLANLLKAATLEERLRARNVELQSALEKLQAAEVQLVQSEKMNALGKLSAGLLHEINNPLNFTLTAIQVARDTAPAGDADLLDTLKDIDEGMGRIRDIVSDLRTFAYPSKEGRDEPLDMRDVVRSALHLTAHELKDVSVDISEVDGTAVLANKTQLTHVLLNLLVNSADALRRAAGAGGAGAADGRTPLIRVRARRGEDDHSVRVTVWDNGEGIRPEDLTKIFDPFFTTRDVGKGMGLGLSICHTIVSNHGGRIVAESEFGQWTAVGFDLPAADGHDGDAAAVPPAGRTGRPVEAGTAIALARNAV